MEHKYGVREIVWEEIRQLAEKYQLKQVILFGSRARGDHHRVSDIDLAVSGGDITRFTLDVEDTTSTLLSFDVINLDSAVQEKLLESIQREGIVIYEEMG
ncbi:MAG: nucleotidyltransferase family protein [Lachnospiraceae bacterium]